jgi:hypothetical protein
MKIVDLRYLRRGVAFKRQQSLISTHSASIISNTNASMPTGLNRDEDISSARVNSVVDELSHYRRWTFNHFTGGDLIYDDVR